MPTARSGGSLANITANRSLDKLISDGELTGHLSLSQRGMKELPRQVLNTDLRDTTDADFSKNRFSELPAELCTYVQMEKLNFYHNCIRSIPASIMNLSNLRQLNLSRNMLTGIPTQLCELPLRVLKASNNRLVSLPKEIGSMQTLMELDISCNEISLLPPEIGSLSQLSSLNIRCNALVELPEEISLLNLRTLDISRNRLSIIPPSVHRMQYLETFIIEQNPLTSPPSHICCKGRVHIFKFLKSVTQCGNNQRGIVDNDNNSSSLFLRSIHRGTSCELNDLKHWNPSFNDSEYMINELDVSCSNSKSNNEDDVKMIAMRTALQINDMYQDRRRLKDPQRRHTAPVGNLPQPKVTSKAVEPTQNSVIVSNHSSTLPLISQTSADNDSMFNIQSLEEEICKELKLKTLIDQKKVINQQLINTAKLDKRRSQLMKQKQTIPQQPGDYPHKMVNNVDAMYIFDTLQQSETMDDGANVNNSLPTHKKPTPKEPRIHQEKKEGKGMRRTQSASTYTEKLRQCIPADSNSLLDQCSRKENMSPIQGPSVSELRKSFELKKEKSSRQQVSELDNPVMSSSLISNGVAPSTETDSNCQINVLNNRLNNSASVDHVTPNSCSSRRLSQDSSISNADSSSSTLTDDNWRHSSCSSMEDPCSRTSPNTPITPHSQEVFQYPTCMPSLSLSPTTTPPSLAQPDVGNVILLPSLFNFQHWREQMILRSVLAQKQQDLINFVEPHPTGLNEKAGSSLPAQQHTTATTQQPSINTIEHHNKHDEFLTKSSEDERCQYNSVYHNLKQRSAFHISGNGNKPIFPENLPDKTNFTVRRHIEQQKDSQDQIEILRRIIEARLKRVLPDDLTGAFNDGVVLCHFINLIKPRSVASIHVPSSAMPMLTMAKCRRNIENFLDACRRLGVTSETSCTAQDILDGNLMKLSRMLQVVSSR